MEGGEGVRIREGERDGKRMRSRDGLGRGGERLRMR